MNNLDGVVLKFVEIVKILHNVRANKDRRRKVDRYIVSYQGTDNYEYREAFEYPVNTYYDYVISNIPLQIS